MLALFLHTLTYMIQYVYIYTVYVYIYIYIFKYIYIYIMGIMNHNDSLSSEGILKHGELENVPLADELPAGKHRKK